MTVMMRKEVGLARRRSRDVEDKQLLTPPPPRLFCQHRDGRGGQRGGQGQQQRGQVNTSTANSKPLSPLQDEDERTKFGSWKKKDRSHLFRRPFAFFTSVGNQTLLKWCFCVCVFGEEGFEKWQSEGIFFGARERDGCGGLEKQEFTINYCI